MKNSRISVLIFVLTLIMCNGLFSQSKYLHLLKDDNVAKAAKKITKDISKKPEDIELNFVMAVLLVNKQYEEYNPVGSYEYLMKSKQNFDNTTDIKTLEKLNKIALNQSVYQDYTDTVCRYALDDAIKQNRIESYQNYLDYYKTAPSYQRNNAIARRNNLAFSQAYQTNTVESFQSFIDKYSEATQKDAAIDRRNVLAFSKASQLNNIQAYKDFIIKYEDAKEARIALERIHALSFEEVLKSNNAADYKKFLDTYPESKQYPQAYKLFEKTQFYEYITGTIDSYQYIRFIEEFPESSMKAIAIDSAFAIIRRTNNLEAAKYCIDQFQDSDKNQALLLYHDLATRDGEKQTLDVFYENFDNDYLSEIKQQDYAVAELGDKLLLELPYDSTRFSDYDAYIQQAAPKEKAFIALQRIISPYLTEHKWETSMNILKHYETLFPYNKNLKNLIELLKTNWDNSIRITPLGIEVNTGIGSEYAPAISANDKLLYFCGRGRADNIGGEDIFVSKMVKAKWGQARLVPGLSTSTTNDAPECISADGTMMILFQSGKLYYSQKKSKGWSDIIEFPEQINAAAWKADAVLSSDGKAILFASIKEGGYNTYNQMLNTRPFHGATNPPTDIYVSTLNSDNQWSELINLGNVINTPYCDRSPFLHPDMKTLYFSSDGHGGLGNLDVYKSTRLADSCWNCWSEPINMGKEINTVGSDWGYKISTNGDVAYFSNASSGSESEDIYSINLPKYLRPEIVATISGKLLDKNNQPISAEIRWEDLETGKNVGQSNSDPTDGSFFIVLPVGKIYGYFVDQDEFFPISNHVDLRTNNKPTHIEENITMIPFRQMIDEDTAVPVNNLFFNFAESALLPYSLPELKRVATIIKANKLNVEISGYTDNVGDDQKNQILSEQRAKSVMDFLVNEGCDVMALSTKGYGKSRPVATNETEDGRAKNRRVELRFVK